ncbi:MAG: hypothetical protein D6702_07395 [Planctomycetota bacterium]|nr:MAG: hypothetical protein D6702_07395 [Planctomycetota bacterium]
MIPFALSLLLAAQAAPAARADRSEIGCNYCHSQEATAAADGIHRRSGIDCLACHGGDGRETGDAARAHDGDFRPLTSPQEAVLACGECHADPARMAHYGLKTDQLNLYRTSSHGSALFEEGAEDVATCLTCHGVHRILPVSDPRSQAFKPRLTRTCMGCHSDRERMSRHGIETTAPEDYAGSVHGRLLLEEGNLASPGCVDCHGSHGAAPPRVEAVEMVCGHCHTPERTQFRRSPHYQASLRGEMEECTSCHSNHAVDDLDSSELTAADGLCTVCHPDPESRARMVARRISEDLDRLQANILEVEEEVEQAARRGLFLRDHEGFVEELKSIRRSSAPVSHASSVEVLDEVVQRGNGMVHKTRRRLEVLAHRFRDLRIFAVVFTFVSLLLVGLMLAYRREL